MLAEDLSRAISERVASLGTLSLKEAEVRLAEELGFDDLELLDSSQRPIHGRTLFKNALETASSIQVVCQLRDPSFKGVGTRQVPELDGSSSGLNRKEPINGSFANLVRELDRIERKGAIWAGFLVREFLPGLGIPAHETRQLVRDLEREGVILTSKRPNPNNPDHPTTFVQLNREHSRVKAVLEAAQERRNESFRPIAIQGGPVSDDIVRDRR